jgi:hypothetical protein
MLLSDSAWRLPLHLLDDDAFCMQQFILDFLETNSITPALPRGKRWEWLKRRIRMWTSLGYRASQWHASQYTT